MAKTTGLGATISVDNSSSALIDVSNDVTNWNMATPRAAQDITGVNKSAYERQLLLADANGSLSVIMNAAVGHLVFRTASSTSVVRTVTVLVAAQTLSIEALLTDYQLARGTDGALTGQVPYSLADGTIPTWT